MILVQSAVKPDWDYAFHNARFLLAAPAEVKVFEPWFSAWASVFASAWWRIRPGGSRQHSLEERKPTEVGQ